MRPRNEGQRFEIRIAGKNKTGYWNGYTVGLYAMAKWFEWPAVTMDEARDKVREYFTTYNALLDGVPPESIKEMK